MPYEIRRGPDPNDCSVCAPLVSLIFLILIFFFVILSDSRWWLPFNGFKACSATTHIICITHVIEKEQRRKPTMNCVRNADFRFMFFSRLWRDSSWNLWPHYIRVRWVVFVIQCLRFFFSNFNLKCALDAGTHMCALCAAQLRITDAFEGKKNIKIQNNRFAGIGWLFPTGSKWLLFNL